MVEDTTAPVVTLNGSSTIELTTADTYTELGATANDHCDGSLSVTVGGDTVDTSAAGTYTVTYSATDSSGNTGTTSRTVTVEDNAIPCGGQQSFSGNRGTYTYDVNLGSSTGGTVVLNYDSFTIPDRFVVQHGGSVVIDTGYVGATSYNDDLADLGLGPITGPGQGTASFVKTDPSTTATVTVSAPLVGTAFTFTLNCPV
ncbi:MAG: hypothetical protein CML17_12230 [Pusillimonas sp.]|nr:hypothetical protein [Pusillimonas sp.]